MLVVVSVFCVFVVFSSRRRHTRCALVTGVQACALPIFIYADERFGLHQLRFNEGAGAYASQSGEIVARWASQWERPELWIFDFHHHLFAGDNGEWVIGIAGLCGLFFVISGVILWWRTRGDRECVV